MTKQMGNETIETYTWWCDLMGLNPSHAQNIERYRKLCERMNKPKWEIRAKYQNGKAKTYILSNLDIENLPKALMIAEEEDIYLQIYRITDLGERTLIFDGLFLQLASEVQHGNEVCR